MFLLYFIKVKKHVFNVYFICELMFLASMVEIGLPSNCVDVIRYCELMFCIDNCVPLLIQQKLPGFNAFNRSWAEYKVGFNDSRGNYWLGNDLLSQLTMTGRYKLRFDLQSRSNTSNWYSAEYSALIVLSESSNYTLHVSGYKGNVRRDALSYHNGMQFTTIDRDNDQKSSGNCVTSYGGGFWYKNCYHCCVNCKYNHFHWSSLPGGDALQSSRMWLLCK